MLNLTHTTQTINQVATMLQQDNDEADVTYWQEEVAKLLVAGEKTLPGTSARHCANLRIMDAQVELLKAKRKLVENEEQELYAAEEWFTAVNKITA